MSSGAESKVLTFRALGAVFTINGTLWCLALVWMASAASRRLRERPRAGVMFTRVAGVLFVGLGVKVAVSR